MKQHDLDNALAKLKVVPVIALEEVSAAKSLAQALVDGGLPVAEVTFRTQGADEVIRQMREAYPDMLIGAGTVLNKTQVLHAKNAGASFIVSPGLNPEVAQFCLDIDMPIIAGVNNPMAIEAALNLGLSTLKFFPAEPSGGVAMLKALLAPYAMLKIMPTGGINLNNINDYLALKNVIACGGSWMVEKALLDKKDWAQVSRLCQEAVQKVN